ncbi:hypothetical protein [Sphingobacterium sp.]|uniref:hypothetical protein n=1 Tax=Sphingobacterium sp. TaxID=341027 RepID=UPI0028AE9C1C|nr:hypothetical protein [Sphingobacterium sp.]
MTLKEYNEKTFIEVKGVLTQQQLNNIYLASSIKAIRDGDEDGDDELYIKMVYLIDIQKIMEKKEKYEICYHLQTLITILAEFVEKNRKLRNEKSVNKYKWN